MLSLFSRKRGQDGKDLVKRHLGEIVKTANSPLSRGKSAPPIRSESLALFILFMYVFKS